MFVWLLRWLSDACCSLHLAAFEKITFRGAVAATVAFALSLLLGPRMIGWLRRRFREPIKSDSPRIRRLHQSKEATPTMGGLFLVTGLLAALVLLADLENPLVQVAIFVTVGLGFVGVVDDLMKLRHASNGISARAKLSGQLAVASVAAVWVYSYHLESAVQ
ncbi:MAG: hypothetical protein JW888_14930, partial [Pirellulales bacterium]|nr:hypothetical protein [Pirellulales bacterium]